jgi:glycosyltransferase involved in cell wall biosynthesis
MPVRNGAEHIQPALESILSQTFHDFEILIIDDASTDQTPDIIAKCRDSRLRLLRNKERLKLAGALNRGLAESRGDYIARMDADDLMRRDRLARQYNYMQRHPDIGCCGGWARTFGAGKSKNLKFPSDAERLKTFALFYTPFAHPTVMFRRDWFERESLRYEGSFYPTEDYELWSRAIMCFPCGNLARVLVDYRLHKNSMTTGEWSDMDAQTIRVQRKILSLLGIVPSETESQIHRAASMGLLPAARESFTRTEAWLLKIRAANSQLAVFANDYLDEILNYVWFRMTMAVVREMGGDSWMLYRQSHLAFFGSRAWIRRLIVKGSALKAKRSRHR